MDPFEVGVRLGMVKIALSHSVIAKASEIKRELKRRYGVNPYLSGSLATGTNLPGESDFDFGIPVQRKKRFLELHDKFKADMKESAYNKGNSDYRVFTTVISGEPVDVALIFGGKGIHHRDAVRNVARTLSARQKKNIIDEKIRLKGAWIAPEFRYKRYKKELDKRLGIPRFSRWQLERKVAEVNPRWQLARSDVFGHRTDNLDSIIESGNLMSAYELARKGKLKSYEHGRWSRGREDASKLNDPDGFRSEVFMTRGLLPSDATYGRYGVLVRSRKASPSPYLNLVPEEHTVQGKVKGKLTFVVPDSEYGYWTKKHPGKRFIMESEVPDKKKIKSSSDFLAPIKRLLSGKLRISHDKKKF